MSSYNITQISLPGLAGSFCNSYPDTFSFSFGPRAPILGALGPGQGTSSTATEPVSGVSGEPGGSGGGITSGAFCS